MPCIQRKGGRAKAADMWVTGKEVRVVVVALAHKTCTT
jgi:hypothetical protein